MKTLIIFFSIMIVFVSMLIFIDDSNTYINLQKYLKALAEECAGGGALFIDESSNKNLYVINEADANKYAVFLKENTYNSNPALFNKNGEIIITVTKYINDRNNPCTKAVCQWKTKGDYKIFRMPFLNSPNPVQQSSVYEIIRY